MRIRQQNTTTATHPELVELLKRLRCDRSFDSDRWLHATTAMLNNYLKQCGIDTCVVGVSGGIDSAVVVGLLAHARNQPGSPLSNIVAVTAPVHAKGVATHQDQTVNYAHDICAHFNVNLTAVDLTVAHQQLTETVNDALGAKGDNWAGGQAVATCRTAALYYTTSVLTSQGHRAVVVGTTNRSEGAWLGYVGKTSDGLVDIQPITDLYKHDVYAIAELFGLDGHIVNQAPNGDMYDGKDDVDVFGAPYDAVETHHEIERRPDGRELLDTLSDEARAQYDDWARHLEALHQVNDHKYRVGSPAVHLDTVDVSQPGGWRDLSDQTWRQPPTDITSTHGWFPTHAIGNLGPTDGSDIEKLDHRAAFVAHLPNAVDPVTLNTLRAAVASVCWVPADTNGRRTTTDEHVGSWRATTHSPEVADHLYSILEPHLENYVAANSSDQLVGDFDNSAVWRPVGVNPLLRFIRYPDGGSLNVHYDAPWIANHTVRSLRSVVVYLDTSGQESRTRIIDDTSRLPDTRSFDDWERCGHHNEVLHSITAQPGDIIMFDHRVAHDSPTTHGSKMVLRVDIMYQRCGPLT